MANFNEKIALVFDVDASKAESGFKQLSTVLSDLESDETDTRTAGQKMAAVLDATADQLEDNFKRARNAADKLAESLGEDGVAAFKNAGRSVDDLVAHLNAAGLSYEQIETDTDSLSRSLKKLNNVGREIDTHVTKNLEGVRGAADRSRGAFSNFLGNSAQELPMLSGAFGPLGQAVGEFAEKAAEGEVALGGLVAAGLGIGVVAVTMSQIAEDAAMVAKTKAFRKEAVDAYVKSLKEGKSQVAALEDHLREVGKIQVQRSGLMGHMFNGDVTDAFARAGLSAERFSQAIAKGPEGLEMLGQALQDAGVPAKDVAKIMLAANDQYDYMQQAAKTAAIASKVFGDATETAGGQAKTAGKWARSYAEGIDAISAAWDILNGKLDGDQAFWDLQATLHDSTASVYDQKKAVAEYIQTVLGMPPTAATKILALIDQGKKAEAEAELNNLARAREATITTRVTQADTHSGTAGGRVQAIEGEQAASGPGRATHNVNITVHVPMTANPVEVGKHTVSAIQAYYRSGGKRL